MSAEPVPSGRARPVDAEIVDGAELSRRTRSWLERSNDQLEIVDLGFLEQTPGAKPGRFEERDDDLLESLDLEHTWYPLHFYAPPGHPLSDD